MTMVTREVLNRGLQLAQALRREGRKEDARIVDALVGAIADESIPARFLTTGQVARRLGVSRQTIVNWVKQGLLPGVKLGGRILIPADALRQVSAVEQVLDQLDAERPPATADEIDQALRPEREKWTWVGKDES